MANFTFGFYNAIDNDRLYDAVEMSEIFDGIINDGVYETIGDRFIIKECDYENHSVIVGSGRAWFNHTWNKLEDSYVLTLDPPHSAYDRIDAIVIEVDTTNRTNAIKPVYGIPAIDPVKPEIMNTNNLHQHPLCYITRKSGQYLIEQRYIENVVGTSETPWVIGVIDIMDASDLYLQWSSSWASFIKEVTEEWATMVAKNDAEQKKITADMQEWIDEKRQYIENDLVKAIEDRKTKIFDDMEKWISGKEAYIMDWFETIKGKLTDDPIVSFQIQLDEMKENSDKILYGFENKQTYEDEDGNIVELMADGRKITTEELENGDIIQKYYTSDGHIKWKKTIHENEDGKIIETVE